MELYEISNNGTLTVSFYKKSKFSDEVHAFKLFGKNADQAIKALSALNVKSFKRVGEKDLEVNYGKGKLIIRDFETCLDSSKKFDELNYRINMKAAKLGPDKSGKALKSHKYHKNKLVKKANHDKSITNFNKKANFTKKENYEFFMDKDGLNCTYASISKLTRQKFAYTYGGKAALNTLGNLKAKVKAFQNLDDNTMEVIYREGKVYIDDYSSLFKNKEFKTIKSEITKRANKLKHKEVRSRFKALNQQSKWVNVERSIKNFAKKATCGTMFCSVIILGTGAVDPTQLLKTSYGYPTNDTQIIYDSPTESEVNPEENNDVKIETDEEKEEETKQENQTEEKKEGVKPVVPKIEAKEEIKAPVTSTNYFEFNFSPRADSSYNTRNNYQAYFEKYGKMYGIDPDLLMAIGAQERGTHSNVIDTGGAIGLMQVQVGVWNGSTLKVFNYNTNEYEYIKITTEQLKNVDFNIRVGAAIYQWNLRTFNYDPIAALQAYNFGYGSVSRLINSYGGNWMAKRTIINGGNFSKGDHLYVEHVLSYLYEDECKLQFTTPNGIKELTVYNKAFEQAKTR